MIEVILLNYLKDALKNTTVRLEMSDQKIEELVIIEKIGGKKVNHLKTSTVAIQSYASSMEKAAVLNEKVKEAIDKLIRESEIISVNLNSDYNFTDTTTKRYRYQAVFDIKHY